METSFTMSIFPWNLPPFQPRRPHPTIPLILFFLASLLLVFLLLLLLLMDLVSPTDHVCYVRCTFCNTVLAVGVPCKWLMDTVTVKCGHCNHLSFLSPRPVMQTLCPTDHQMVFQGPCSDCRRGQPSSQSSSTSSEQIIPKTSFVVKPPEKKHRLPSAYNRFMKEEIQRIKAAKPDIPHREAFSMAAKNWAKCDPRCSTTVSTSEEAVETVTLPHERENGLTVESFDVLKQLERKD